MNEKIKELAIQAKIQMVSEPRLAEFANLLIKECIDAVESMDTLKGATTYDKDLVDSVKHHCSQAIKRKFV